MYLSLNSIRLYFCRYRYVVRQNVLSGKCLFGQRPRARPLGSYTPGEEVFIPNTPSISFSNDPKQLFNFCFNWLAPGLRLYIHARGKRNNIPSVCERIYTNAEGIPCRFCAGCFRLTARLIDDHNSKSYTQSTPPSSNIYPYYMIFLLPCIVT